MKVKSFWTRHFLYKGDLGRLFYGIDGKLYWAPVYDENVFNVDLQRAILIPDYRQACLQGDLEDSPVYYPAAYKSKNDPFYCSTVTHHVQMEMF